jgi:phosphoribosylformylglycinamidine (FGAM) synthase PurS component
LNFQIIQTTDNQLVVKLKMNQKDKNIEEKVKSNLENLLAKNNIHDCKIIFQPFIHEDFFNKFRRVKREF